MHSNTEEVKRYIAKLEGDLKSTLDQHETLLVKFEGQLKS